jgi:uncharacterized membrane protein YdjX (TVP38/TMEM64 family)
MKFLAFGPAFLVLFSYCHGFQQPRATHNKIGRGQSSVKLLKEDNSFKKRDDDIWTSRRKIIRTTLKPIVKSKLEKKISEKDKPVEIVAEDDEEKKKKPTGLLVSAFFIAVSATVLRLGGRTAFINMLGLDFVTGSGIKTQVDEFVTFFHSLGDTTEYLAIFVAWLVAKILCVDAFTIILALSSGVLFGGLLQGTAVSVLCSSTASLCIFFTSRYFLREKSLLEIARRPAYRAVDRACAKQGFKTVFTLRLSPILPIPIAAYNYLYGATSVSALDFFAGISLGSIKPYLLDSYLGLFGKSLIDEKDLASAGGEYGDMALLGFISVVILVGAFATEVAASTWEEIQKENDLDMLNNPSSDQMVIDGIAIEGMKAGSEVEMKLANSQVFRMLGVTAGDLGKLPGWLRRSIDDVFSAQNRVDTVIADEILAVTYELEKGIDLSWDLGVHSMEGLNQDKDNNVDKKNDFTPLSLLTYAYPGERHINEFENVIPDISNVKEYTYESLVFSFSLIGAVGTLLSEDGLDKIQSKDPITSPVIV